MLSQLSARQLHQRLQRTLPIAPQAPSETTPLQVGPSLKFSRLPLQTPPPALRLLQEEKLRKAVARDLPRMNAKLLELVDQWQAGKQNKETICDRSFSKDPCAIIEQKRRPRTTPDPMPPPRKQSTTQEERSATGKEEEKLTFRGVCIKEIIRSQVGEGDLHEIQRGCMSTSHIRRDL